VTENDKAARLEDLPLADDPERVPLLEELIGRVEEDEVEADALLR
jgi:hypothetical protein